MGVSRFTDLGITTEYDSETGVILNVYKADTEKAKKLDSKRKNYNPQQRLATSKGKTLTKERFYPRLAERLDDLIDRQLGQKSYEILRDFMDDLKNELTPYEIGKMYADAKISGIDIEKEIWYLDEQGANSFLNEFIEFLPTDFDKDYNSMLNEASEYDNGYSDYDIL